MKNWIIIGLVFVLLFGFGCVSVDKQESVPEIFKRCNSDSDCVLVQVPGCCNFISINKNYKGLFNEFHGMTCTMVCTQVPKCVNNQCQVAFVNDSL